MFNFMKKDKSEKEKEEKERKKKERKEVKKAKDRERLSVEELHRLDEVRRSLKIRSRRKEKEKLPSGIIADYSANFTSAFNPCDALSSSGSGSSGMEEYRNGNGSVKVRPPVPPKPPQRGILKGKTGDVYYQGVSGGVDDVGSLVRNTLQNEVIAADGTYGPYDLLPTPRRLGSPPGSPSSRRDNGLAPPVSPTFPTSASSSSLTPSFATPPMSPTPAGESPGFPFVHHFLLQNPGLDLDLSLPPLAPVQPPSPAVLSVPRQPAGDFGFSLRRAMLGSGVTSAVAGRRNVVIFAEPSALGKANKTGLLPGDRLVEVNGVNVEDRTREDIIEMIRASGDSVTLKVQPLVELSELNRRCQGDVRRRRLDSAADEDYAEVDAELRGGTLRRSGSRRFAKTGAKSEEQVVSERAWLDSERVWLLHRGGFAAAQLLDGQHGNGESDGRLCLRLEATDEVVEVDEDDVEKANPPQFDMAEDLSHLPYLTESSVLHTLRQRYGASLVHTYAGPTMVIINPMSAPVSYSEKVMQMFRGCKAEDMPPHIYSVAQTAYRNMLATRSDQAVALLGRSGSGKTTNFRHLLHCLAHLTSAPNKVVTVEKVNAATTLLETFGNSRTVMNVNATRFTQIFSLDFDNAGLVASASVQMLLLEKSRVARRPEGEPNFHVFYQLLAGAQGPLRKELLLDGPLEPSLFATPLQKAEERQRAALAWGRLVGSMQVLGVSDSEAKAVWSVLSAIYHLGSAGATRGHGGKPHFVHPQAAQKAATLLGTSLEELGRAVFQGCGTTPTMSAPSSSSGAGDGTSADALELLEAMAVGLYGEAMASLVSLVNRAISSPVQIASSILLVDTPGLQNPASCGRQGGATFQELCHNYLQERLQMLFHDVTFVNPQDQYAQEQVDCNFEELRGEGLGPAPLVSLMDRPSQTALVRTSQTDLKDADRRGLLWLLDEEAIYPGASDETFLEKLHAMYNEREHQYLFRRGPGPRQFVLHHFQGTNSVVYTISDWLKASQDSPLIKRAATLLHESQHENISILFNTTRGPLASSLSSSVAGIEGTHSLRRVSSIRRTFNTGTAGIKRKSVALQVKYQVDGLIETLRRARVRFVHCFLPQHSAGLCELKGTLPQRGQDGLMNVPLLRSQLRGAQILEAVRVHKQGFPESLPFAEFRRRFHLLAPSEARQRVPWGSVLDERKAAEELVQHLDVERSCVRVGLSRIFFRPSILAQLEAQRDQQLQGRVIEFQAICRGYLSRKQFAKRKVQDLAVRCIQRNVRKFMVVRDWPWWRLLVRVSPLLNVHRTEQELRTKTDELEALRTKLDKLEKERNQLKYDNDRLETKVSELSADLAEEQSTSTLASERLEAEAAERMKLEKDVQDLQTRFNSAQHSNEKLETELLYRRAADMNGDLASEGEEEEDAADGIIRQKYDRASREVEFLRRQLQQQKEDDLEQTVTLKKQLEKKVGDAYEEVEEQRQVAAQWKRKAQKVSGELNDVKLMLEEQTSRNGLLEKKQRKFDSELQLLQEQIRQERQQREQMVRDRDVAQTEKFTLEQSLCSLKLEVELKEEKLSSLSRELEDLTFGGKTEEEVATLKRVRHELEVRVKDQEEELDDLAGQVQLLEQAKLRLEMLMEQMRKEGRREAQQREEEVEEARSSAQKRLRTMEAQLEGEHEERTLLLREKHDLERRLVEAQEQAGGRGPDQEAAQRLKKELRRTKALLRDAQTMLERMRSETPNKGLLRQIRNQLEDSEFARCAAVKARQNAEMELQEVQSQLEESQRVKADAEERQLRLSREKAELQSHLDENEEELAEVMKKYKATVQQLSVDQVTLQEQSVQIAELESQRNALKEQLAEMSTKLEVLEGDSASSAQQKRLELKVRELESRLGLENTTRSRQETQVHRLKETVDKLHLECQSIRSKEQAALETNRRLQRQLRESREDQAASQQREVNAAQRAAQLEKKLETAEAELQIARGDIKLALQRIEDLQAAMQGGSDSDSDDARDSDRDSSSEESVEGFLAGHSSGVQDLDLSSRSPGSDVGLTSPEPAPGTRPMEKESFA